MLTGHKHIVEKVSFTNDDESIVFADDDDGIKVWSLEDKKQIFEFRYLEEASNWLLNKREKEVSFQNIYFSHWLIMSYLLKLIRC